MTINAGVWIDHHRAVIVHLTDRREDVRQVQSDWAATPKGESGSKNDFVAEDKRERKETILLNKFFDKVIVCLHDAEAILILGPGKAKGEFRNRLKSQKFKGKVAALKTVDKLTDPQIAAHVREHFTNRNCS
jgi:hypothetical protein